MIALKDERTADGRAGRALLSGLYEPPLLMHLLEAGRWDAAERKLRDVFAELRGGRDVTQAHLREVYHMCCLSCSYAARRHGRMPEETPSFGAQPADVRGMEQWAFRLLQSIRDAGASAAEPHRSEIVHHVRRLVQQHLHEDISLQVLSEKVHLHPKYLSWLYKHETGEPLSEYINRLKMERAAHWLKHSRKKVYEIAAGLGYRNTSYFIRVFKEKFQMTPQAFRNQ